MALTKITSRILDSSGVTILGTIATGVWAATDIAVLHGGTGASTAGAARTNLGLVIGTHILAQRTFNDSNWDNAYTDRLKWDGGATGLTASTGRTSLGLGTVATTAASDYATAAQGTKADTAHGWGNHTGGGYVKTTTDQTIAGNKTFSGTTSANVVIARDNMFVGAGQLYIGAENSSTNNSFRQEVSLANGTYKLQSRESGTWTDAMGFDNSLNATFSGNVIAPKIGVGALNTSFDFYNNGTSYLNGTTTVDAALNQTGGAASTFSGRANFNGNVNIVSANAEIWIGEGTGGGSAGFLKWDDTNNYLYLGNSYGSAYNKNIVISSSGKVGIGTDSPTQELEIKAASVPTLKFNQAGTYGAEIALRGNDLDIAGSANDIVFYTGGNNDVSTTERLRITSTGSATFRSSQTAGNIQVRAHSGNSSNAGYGALQVLQNSGGRAGYITMGDTSYGDDYYAQANTFTLAATANAGLKLRAFASNTRGITIGSSWANDLDAYEEGTWTPVITASGGNAATATWGSTAKFTRIGTIVHIVAYSGNININAMTSGTYILVTGLPFTSNSYGDFTVAYKAGNWTGGNIIGGYVQSGSAYIYLMRADGSEAQQQSNDIALTKIMINVTYSIN